MFPEACEFLVCAQEGDTLYSIDQRSIYRKRFQHLGGTPNCDWSFCRRPASAHADYDHGRSSVDKALRRWVKPVRGFNGELLRRHDRRSRNRAGTSIGGIHRPRTLHLHWLRHVGVDHCIARADLPPGSEVVLPSICCDDVPLAVRNAGLAPALCDVSTSDYNMDAKFVENVLSPRTRAMIAVHLFGYPCQMDALLKLAEEGSLIVVEDAAQALGGSLGTRKLGSFGELSVLSFAYRKIIDVGGGGAILTNDHSLAKEIREYQLRYQRFNHLTAMAYAIPGNALRLAAEVKAKGIRVPTKLPGQSPLWWRTRSRFMKPAWAERISRAMGTLADVVSLRRRNVMIYRETISSPHVLHPEYQHDGWACFRYSVLTKTVCGERVRAELEKRGILGN